jgi:hypothetical protein
MQNTQSNISAEDIARPFARVVAVEFSRDVVDSVVAKGCFLSSGTNPDVWRDAGDDGT